MAKKKKKSLLGLGLLGAGAYLLLTQAQATNQDMGGGAGRGFYIPQEQGYLTAPKKEAIVPEINYNFPAPTFPATPNDVFSASQSPPKSPFPAYPTSAGTGGTSKKQRQLKPSDYVTAQRTTYSQEHPKDTKKRSHVISGTKMYAFGKPIGTVYSATPSQMTSMELKKGEAVAVKKTFTQVPTKYAHINIPKSLRTTPAPKKKPRHTSWWSRTWTHIKRWF